MGALEQLRQAVIQQKSAHLPDLPAGTQLEGLQARLAAYDEATTLRVRSALQGQPTMPLVDEAGAIEEMMDRLQSGAGLSPDDDRALRRLRGFKQRQDALNSLADQIAAAPGSQEG